MVKFDRLDEMRSVRTQDAFFDLMARVREKLPAEPGFYLSPYLRGFRKSPPDHDIFVRTPAFVVYDLNSEAPSG